MVLAGASDELVSELVVAFDRLLERARRAGAVAVDVTAEDLRALVCGVQHASSVTGSNQADRYLRVLLNGIRP